MQTASKKVINAWCMYDWANSVYNLVITSTIFPAYYESMTGDGNEQTTDYVHFLGMKFVNTALYNYALAVAFFLVAIFSPLLSSIADFKGNKKSFLRFFMSMGSIACALLFFYDKSNLWLGVTASIVACVGYWASIVFYNSFLPEIASIEDRDRVSARGFSMGYIGSVILQILSFILIMKNDWFGISAGKGSQISFLLVGIWWFGFAQIPLKILPNPVPAGKPAARNVLMNGYRELQKVWNQLTHIPILKRFLIAFFFYNMGVQTVMLAATLYGKSELAIPTENLIIAILIIQLIAIPGAFLISRLSGRIGNLRSLIICVLIWIGVCISAYYMPAGKVNQFYILASVVGFIMGGIQSLSRSTYAKLMPVTKDTTSFFSFFDVTEKIAIVIGMFSFGFLNEITGSQRSSVLALLVYFVIGLLLLFNTISAQKKGK